MGWGKGCEASLFTTYLGPLGCRVTSKGMGIGKAERHWKANKKIRGGQRAKLSPKNAKMQATMPPIIAWRDLH